MGGFGSGRYEYATTPTIEECRHLNIDRFTDAVDRPGTGGTIHWGGSEDPDASVTLVMLSDDHMTALKDGETLEATPIEDGERDEHGDGSERATAVYLTYTVTDTRTGESTDVSYHVPLEYTECNFGGSRPWFRCPGVVDGQHCGERVGKLYLPPRQDLFLCRECYDLGYRSSRTSGDDVKQAELRYRRAFAKADAQDRRAHPASEPWLPERPKGMHHETFQDLLDDVHAASEDWHDAMQARTREHAKQLSDRHDGVDGLV